MIALCAGMSTTAFAACRDNVVLVHGNTASPSSWNNTINELKRKGYDKDTALALGKNIKEDIFEEREEQMFDIKDPTVDPMISGLLQEAKGYEERYTLL